MGPCKTGRDLLNEVQGGCGVEVLRRRGGVERGAGRLRLRSRRNCAVRDGWRGCVAGGQRGDGRRAGGLVPRALLGAGAVVERVLLFGAPRSFPPFWQHQVLANDRAAIRIDDGGGDRGRALGGVVQQGWHLRGAGREVGLCVGPSPQGGTVQARLKDGSASKVPCSIPQGEAGPGGGHEAGPDAGVKVTPGPAQAAHDAVPNKFPEQEAVHAVLKPEERVLPTHDGREGGLPPVGRRGMGIFASPGEAAPARQVRPAYLFLAAGRDGAPTGELAVGKGHLENGRAVVQNRRGEFIPGGTNAGGISSPAHGPGPLEALSR